VRSFAGHNVVGDEELELPEMVVSESGDSFPSSAAASVINGEVILVDIVGSALWPGPRIDMETWKACLEIDIRCFFLGAEDYKEQNHASICRT
jgi:hypothetical protein